MFLVGALRPPVRSLAETEDYGVNSYLEFSSRFERVGHPSVGLSGIAAELKLEDDHIGERFSEPNHEIGPDLTSGGARQLIAQNPPFFREASEFIKKDFEAMDA